jgi:serine/threonine protein kinase
MAQNEVTLLSGSPAATLLGGIAVDVRAQELPSATATWRGLAEPPEPVAIIDIDDTSESLGDTFPSATASVRESTVRTRPGRTTVLPRRQKSGQEAPHVLERARFERIRVLGKGAMGEVELALDHDIRRRVAVKRVLGGAASQEALLRFADEIRVVGQLEHPSIVPIYDVGQDEDGQLYLVMKHLQGETMEEVLRKLRAGDEATSARFTVDYRLHLFFAVLDAMRYAHARGILHRDLKPANIQIGPYGEVTIMDWGIARPYKRGEQKLEAEPLDRTVLESHDARLVETHLGSLAGTPLYMSPEQAAGRNDELDDRSDVYALSVVLHEWLTLEHPMKARGTVIETLAATISEDYDAHDLIARSRAEGVPIQYVYVIHKGLARHRQRRFQNVAELEDALKQARDGFIPVHCPVTLGKHVMYNSLRWIDRHQLLFTLLLFTGASTLLGGLGYGLWRAVQALS